MKLKLLNISLFLIIGLLLFCFQNKAFSQESSILQSKNPGFFIGVSMGPSLSTIKGEGTQLFSNLIFNNQNSYFGSLEIGYFFSEYIGLSTGVNYVSYKSQLILDSYQNSFGTIDSEGDDYEMSITGSGIKEMQTVDVLSIPLCLNLRLPFSKTVGFFLKGGVSMSFPLNQKYSSTGIFTYKGFYAQYNDLLENFPEFGFPTNISITTAEPLQQKSIGISPSISTGLDYYIKEKIQIALGVSYRNMKLGLKEGSTSTDKFQLSPDATHINSLVGGSSKSTAQSMGIDFSVKFYL